MTPSVTAFHERELRFHEWLYAGEAQRLFRKPAVRALRRHMVGRIVSRTGAGRSTRVLSLGCGIGDLEIALGPHVAEIVGVDLSPAGVCQAREDTERTGLANVRFVQGALPDLPPGLGPFDLVLAIFLLHHLPEPILAACPVLIRGLLAPAGMFYSLDPGRRRLSAALGRVVVPGLMRRYQSPDERELIPEATAAIFRADGFDCRLEVYDFASTPLAGLLPSWRAGYRAARALDEVLVRLPGLRHLGSNFEIVATVDGRRAPPA